jgi:hypothetical protein
MTATAATDSTLLDLFVMVCEALEAAEGELDQIAESSYPVPDDLQKALDERLALIGTLKHVRAGVQMGNAAKLTGARLDALYREEAAKGENHDYRSMPAFPVLPGIREELTECRERLRRAALADPDLDSALRRVLPKGWAW